jgi:hypothetical protein
MRVTTPLFSILSELQETTTLIKIHNTLPYTMYFMIYNAN